MKAAKAWRTHKKQYERQLKELEEAYGEAMPELRTRKKLTSLLGEEDK